MGWSWKLFTAFGIGVYAHFSFIIFLLVMATIGYASAGPDAALARLAVTAAVFGSVILHEYGHCLAARQFGIGTYEITLLPIGGIARLTFMPTNPWEELWITVAGPAVNVVIAAFVIFAGPALGMAVENPTSISSQIATINIGLFVFNMIPAIPMDGGRVLRSVLSMFFGRPRATLWACRTSQVLGVVFVGVGIWAGMPMLIIIAIFLWLGSTDELAQEK